MSPLDGAIQVIELLGKAERIKIMIKLEKLKTLQSVGVTVKSSDLDMDLTSLMITSMLTI